MNNKNIKSVKNNKLCMNCLKEEYTKKYYIKSRGFNSIFDGYKTHLQVCSKCDKEEFKIWFNEQPSTYDGYCEEYEYEDKILEFIHNLPLQSQELFFNTFNSNEQYFIDAQDWIDYQLDELSHEKCNEYGLIYNKRN